MAPRCMRSITVPILFACVARGQLETLLRPTARLPRPLSQPNLWNLNTNPNPGRGSGPIRAEGFGAGSKYESKLFKGKKARSPDPLPQWNKKPTHQEGNAVLFNIVNDICEETEVPLDKVTTIVMVSGLMKGDCWSRGYKEKVGSKELKIPFFGDFPLIKYKKPSGQNSGEILVDGQFIARENIRDHVFVPLMALISLSIGHSFASAVRWSRRGAIDEPLLTT